MARGFSSDEIAQQLGTPLQFFLPCLLPMIVWWQLQFGFPLIWMPALLTVGIVVFWLGTRLRES